MADVGDAFKPIVPIVIFVAVLALCISSMGQLFTVGASPTDNPSYDVPSRYGIRSVEYDNYMVDGNVSRPSWNAHNATGYETRFWGGDSWKELSGDVNDTVWLNPTYGDEFHIQYVRNNTLWDGTDHNGTIDLSKSTTLGDEWYKDYFSVEYNRHTWLKIFWVTYWRLPVSFDRILDNRNGNISIVGLNVASNLSLIVTWNAAITNYENALLNNQFNITLAKPINENIDAWTLVWNILTFNTAWVGDLGLLGIFVSLFLDVTIALVVVKVILAVIPFT